MTSPNARPFRVIDTGVREGRRQIAFDQALIELHHAGKVADTIRFLRFPPTALIGRHQALSQEIDLDYCRLNNIGLVRRITGGGAIYLDEGQLGWELVFSRKRLALGSLSDCTKAICEAVAAGLAKSFDIEARFRPRNDIEVGGRKLCGTGGFFEGDTLIYQGTVLIDVDPERMMACLNVPAAKLGKRDLDSAGQRVVTLRELLGGEVPSISAVQHAVLSGLSACLGIEPRQAVILDEEEARAEALYDDVIGTDAFVREIDQPGGTDVRTASLTSPGGTVSAYVRLAGASPRISDILITGDFFVTPPRMVFDLEAELRGLPAAEAGPVVERFFARSRAELLSVVPETFKSVIEAALEARATA